MKRSSSAALLGAGAVLALALAGCGGGSTPAGGGGSNAASSTPGVTSTEIVFGANTPFDGPAAAYHYINEGAAAYFDYVNDHGGVYGRKIRYILLNDSYDPSKTVQVAKQLVEQDHVFSMVGTLGTPTTEAEMPYLQQNHVPDVAIETGSKSWEVPFKPDWFGLETNYTVEGELDAWFAVNYLHAHRIAVWYQNDDFGGELLAGLKMGLQKYANGTAQIVTQVPYEVTETNFTPDATQVNSQHPDLVVLYGVPGPTAQYVKAQYNAGFRPPHQLVTQVSNDPSMPVNAGPGWNGMYAGSWLQLLSENTPQMQTFKQAVKKYYPDITDLNFAEAGWVEGQVVVEGLKLAGKNLTRQTFIQGLEKIHNFTDTLAAGPINYSPTEHWGFDGLFFVQWVNQNGQWVEKPVTQTKFLPDPYAKK
ncbi:MAG: ABC transporter substrate-binding protein [Actinomycetia bacterium]|nr:ABC transporter substrate-binding protein [Actinomycetes bacterium]